MERRETRAVLRSHRSDWEWNAVGAACSECPEAVENRYERPENEGLEEPSGEASESEKAA